MEFDEGKSLSWNPLKNVPGSSSQISFVKSKGVHPVSCCLCAISSETQNEVLLGEEEDSPISTDEEYPEDHRIHGNVIRGISFRLLKEGVKCDDTITPFKDTFESLENSLGLQEFESDDTLKSSFPVSLEDFENECCLKCTHSLAQEEELENVESLEDSKGFSSEEFFQNEELSEDVFLESYSLQINTVQISEDNYIENINQVEGRPLLCNAESSTSVDEIGNYIDKVDAVSAPVQKEAEVTIADEKIDEGSNSSDKFAVEKSRRDGEDDLSTCCEFSKQPSAMEVDDQENDVKVDDVSFETDNDMKVDDLSFNTDNDDIYYLDVCSDNNDTVKNENSNEFMATAESKLDVAKTSGIQFEDTDELSLQQSDHLTMKSNPIILQEGVLHVTEMEITCVLEHEETDETSDYSSQEDSSLSCDGSTNTENFTNDNLSEKEEEIERQKNTFVENVGATDSFVYCTAFCTQHNENCDKPAHHCDIISDVPIDGDINASSIDDAASAVISNSQPLTLDSADEDLVNNEILAPDDNFTSAPECQVDSDKSYVFCCEEQNEKKILSIPEGDFECDGYDICSPEGVSPSPESAAQSSDTEETFPENANEEILNSETESPDSEKDDSNLIAFSIQDIEINSCAPSSLFQENISIEHCIEGGEEPREDEGGEEEYRNNIEGVNNSGLDLRPAPSIPLDGCDEEICSEIQEIKFGDSSLNDNDVNKSCDDSISYNESESIHLYDALYEKTKRILNLPPDLNLTDDNELRISCKSIDVITEFDDKEIVEVSVKDGCVDSVRITESCETENNFTSVINPKNEKKNSSQNIVEKISEIIYSISILTTDHSDNECLTDIISESEPLSMFPDDSSSYDSELSLVNDQLYLKESFEVPIESSDSEDSYRADRPILSETPLPTITEEREDISLTFVENLVRPNTFCRLSWSEEFHGSNSQLEVLNEQKLQGDVDVSAEIVEGNCSSGLQLIVDGVVRNIPDIVLLMQEEKEEEYSECEESVGDDDDDVNEDILSETESEYFFLRPPAEDIVMMNDDESFVTIVQDVPSANETTHVKTIYTGDVDVYFDPGYKEQQPKNEIVILRHADKDEEISKVKHNHSLDSTLKRRLSKFERRLSSISLNRFLLKAPPPEEVKAGDDVAKSRRPLSGVRKKLASSRRKTNKVPLEHSLSQDLAESDYAASFIIPTGFKVERRPSEEAERIGLSIKNWRRERVVKRRCVSGHERTFQSFGKRAQGGGRRPNECLILEPSEMMVIDYPDVQLLHPGQRSSVNQRTIEKFHLALDHRDLALRGAGGGSCSLNSSSGPLADGAPPHFHTHPHLQQLHHELPDLLRGGRSRGSVGSSVRDGSDTSSAYSGSDTMCQSIHSLDHEDVDLSGLMESVVDSDEEDLVENVESMSVQDTVRECLEKDPGDRIESDIKVLLEFTERLSAFANMTVGVRRAMCQAMVFAVVEESGTILMNDGEELDSWSVIINGHVEVSHPDSTVHKLHLGDSFGITPTMEKLYHHGVMRSMVDDCQFVCIRQSDYYRILRQGEENTRRLEEDGVTVLVTEKSHIDACHREANIVIKGTPERLMLHLVEVENVLDPTYVEDFLLMHRKFIKSAILVMKKLLEWFEDPKYQDIVTRVILRWVQSHFTDFEMDPQMMNYLEQFEEGLQRKEMTGQLLFLRVVCMTKARSRIVTLTRPSREAQLQFTVQGGKNFGIFISHVEKGSKAEEAGLKRADQVLEVNGQSFLNMNRTKALEIVNSTCHLAITVRSNLHAYNDMLQTPENSHKPKNRKASEFGSNGTCPGTIDFASTLNLNSALSPQLLHSRKEGKGTSMTLKTHKFKEFLVNMVGKSNIIDTPVCSDDSVSSASHSSTGGHLYRSRSNPDLSSTEYEESCRSEFPEHVLKVYRATDQSTRFLPVHKETTAREVVMLSLRLFTITEPSKNFALYEVSVTEQGVVKQKRLPDGLQNLAERIGLSSRYYLKSVTSTQNLCPEEIVQELIRESQVSILQLNSVVELAIQLTLENFAIFRQIEPTEYVDDLFKLKSKYGTPALTKFEEISNKELYWVCAEVCSERNIYKRAKIIKQFIKISKYCKDLNNYNSMFAVLSGLGSTSVRRLRQTWSKVPNRYVKTFHDLENIMNPSQNMKNYRTLASSSSSQSPMIPFYPIVKKDLLFLNEGNDDEVDGLINFEKLRTISKSIRKLGEMCSAKYFPDKMLEKLGQPSSTAMSAMNQGITGSQQSSTVKRRKKSTAQPDKKKMFEEAQMVRRVKAYLSQLKVIKDEDLLLKMSYECEPPAQSHTGGGGIGSSHLIVGSSSSSSSSSSSGQPSTNGSNSAPPSNPQTRRRNHSPTPSTASSNSSTSHTSEGKKTHARFGAASPTSERKMLSLAEATKKPYHGPRPPTSAPALSQSSNSPNPSPGVLRRGPAAPLPVAAPCPSVRGNHERSHSDTPVSSVDLNVESSSVTSLSSLANLRKSLTSGSVTSNECHGSQGETDSGISTHFDCHSSSSLEGGGGVAVAYDGHYPPSPPSHHRRFSHQSDMNFKVPFPHAVKVLPPIPSDVCGGRLIRRGVSGGPPDYTSTQMRIQQLGRALSHDGVQYYPHNRLAADDEDEAQVSAV